MRKTVLKVLLVMIVSLLISSQPAGATYVSSDTTGGVGVEREISQVQPVDTVTMPVLQTLSVMFGILGPMFFSFDDNIMNSTVLGPMGLFVLPRFNDVIRAIIDPMQKHYVGRSMVDLPAQQVIKELQSHPLSYVVLDDRAEAEFEGFRAVGTHNIPIMEMEKFFKAGVLEDGTILKGKRLIVMCA